ncbi:unnamed protein product [Blepharisma stoltei]|uniref:Uncharacterized protein n=1 Tax=Blepharisma stoltei TaxID=1481888 RepID=A0AAU9K8N5_9CILI|nr:unnamed protein product [Blepharisma stoltei]
MEWQSNFFAINLILKSCFINMEPSYYDKQLNLLNEGKTYEFAQNILNRARRLISRGQHAESIDIALRAALELLKRQTIPNELLDIIVQTSQNSPPNSDLIEEIYSHLSAPNDIAFLKKLCKNCPDPKIYALIARALDDSGDLGKSLLYWIGAGSYREIIRILQILIDRGYPGEIDLFVCRTVLILLSFKNLSLAQHIIGEFKYVDTPLLNFTRFLIQALDVKEFSLVGILKERYAPTLQRDLNLIKYLEHVEKAFSAEAPNYIPNILD